MTARMSKAVKGLHLSLLLLVVAVATAQANPRSPRSTTGCCDVTEDNCKGCRRNPDYVTVVYVKLPDSNPYQRCGTTGYSPDGCSEASRVCFTSAPGMVKGYSDGACTNLSAIVDPFTVQSSQCPVDIFPLPLCEAE